MSKLPGREAGRSGGPVGWLIAASAGRPVFTLLLVLGLAVWGWFALVHSPLDAIPDLSDVQVIVFTEWMGQSPDRVEDQVTYPITASLLAAPKVEFVRGLSMFGMSFVYVIFEDGTDLYWARSRVLEYLNEARGRLPDGVEPTLGPDATAVGWVFQYALVDDSGALDLGELRSLQDWQIRYALEGVPGVAEVAAVGGFEKEYQVTLDPLRLASLGIPLERVSAALAAAGQDVGGGSLEQAGHEVVVRGKTSARSAEDLATIPLKLNEAGVPVLVRDVGRVQAGPAPRRGFAELDGRGEVVGGVVVMRFGENALNVLAAVKARIAELQDTLPTGVRIVTVYDRSPLIEGAIDTLRGTLIEEMVVVSVVIFLFLLHARSALVPILTLPIAVLLSFVPMFYQGLTINIMSLGGIAVAIGAMVDAAIILIENIHKRLEDAPSTLGQEERRRLMIQAMQEVGPSLFFSLLVITVSFLPIFTLEGVEGRLFSPLAFTKTYSMGFAAVLAVTLTPALAALFIRGRIRREEANPLNRWLVAAYTPVARGVVRWRWAVVVVAGLGVAATVPAYLSLENEFMPPLAEGVILYMPTAPPGMAPSEALRVLGAMDRTLATFPEVASVFGKMGRADSATDPAPIGMVETVVVLKPQAEWRPGLTYEALITEMDAKLRFPGMPNLWWMPVQTRTEMLSTGIRSPLGIKVFGDDLDTIEQAAIEVERVVAKIPGTRSAFADRATGGLYLDFEVDRLAAARYGLTAGQVGEAVATAVGGVKVGEILEGRQRFAITVRYGRDFRQDPAALGRALVATEQGAQVALAQLGHFEAATGPPMIRSEDGRLVGYVFVDVGERALANYVEEARRVVAAEARLPPAVWLEWSGQFTYFERAKRRLQWVVPVTLVLICLLLYLNTQSMVEVGIVLLAVPFSLIGAVWLLVFLDYNLSVAVWVGLIALAGLDAETGVVMLLYLTLSHRKWKSEGRLVDRGALREAIVEGAARRIRPKLMTVLTTFVGLLPVLWSTGVGADVMKRIAAPMVGGLVTSFLLELLVYPAIFAIWKGREVGMEQPEVAVG